MFAKTFGSSLHGIEARLITVEVNIVNGMNFYVTGLADSAVKESQHRVESAIRSLGYLFPREKTVINLAPADLRKEGAAYDLPIALGVLISSHQVKAERFSDYMILGELALDGTLRPIKGVLPFALEARKRGLKGFLLPEINAYEAAVVDNLEVIPITHLNDAIEFLDEKRDIAPVKKDINEVFEINGSTFSLDFSEVQGQENIKRAMEIAAAGGHNMIMIGPPGAGKTMLARRLPTILPPLTLNEALETTKVYSVAGKLSASQSLITQRPFRGPHHTISDVALVGGGGFPQPGEISMAHNGVLFLDELPEYRRTVLEVMRQPIEERKVTISRAKHSIDYPANFMLIASMNPCPCGFYNHPERECLCHPGTVQKYLNKISGPLLDRIDLHVEVTPVSFDQMIGTVRTESSAEVRKRVVQAREIQRARFKETDNLYSNAMLGSGMVKKVCRLDDAGQLLLRRAMDRLGLSARAYDRILKVSRTIADLSASTHIRTEHIAEAIQYRSLDRENWGKG